MEISIFKCIQYQESKSVIYTCWKTANGRIQLLTLILDSNPSDEIALEQIDFWNQQLTHWLELTFSKLWIEKNSEKLLNK